jgi:hypothetical protein
VADRNVGKRDGRRTPNFDNLKIEIQQQHTLLVESDRARGYVWIRGRSRQHTLLVLARIRTSDGDSMTTVGSIRTSDGDSMTTFGSV